jgi:hypothetical protein
VFQKRPDPNSKYGRVARFGLAPVIWAIILGLLYLFVVTILLSSSLSEISAPEAIWGWLAVISALGGLGIMWRATTRDPGFISRRDEGGDSASVSPDLIFRCVCMNGRLFESVQLSYEYLLPEANNEELWLVLHLGNAAARSVAPWWQGSFWFGYC